MTHLRSIKRLICVLMLWVCTTSAQAHLMVAQQGTLNMLGDGAFIVLSLPVSAFAGADDDADGMLSIDELQAHQASIFSTVHRGLSVSDETGARPLQGLMVNLASPDESPTAPSAQLVVLGRFALATSGKKLRLRVDIFGTAQGEQTYQIKAIKSSETHWLVLTPERSERTLFAPAEEVFFDFIQLGVIHIMTGYDHLLFLLVVIASYRVWRHALLSLSCFTVGHAITLVLSVWEVFTVPATVVEPAIATTIVAMTLFDWCARRMQRPPAYKIRMLLVFICSLIHGLGLGTALTSLGLDTQHHMLSLVGFNMGIELGQIAVVGLASVSVVFVRRLLQPSGLKPI